MTNKTKNSSEKKNAADKYFVITRCRVNKKNLLATDWDVNYFSNIASVLNLQCLGWVQINCDLILNVALVMAVEIKFSKSNTTTPWGFRLVGGAEFDQPLIVVKVSARKLVHEFVNRFGKTSCLFRCIIFHLTNLKDTHDRSAVDNDELIIAFTNVSLLLLCIAIIYFV